MKCGEIVASHVISYVDRILSVRFLIPKRGGGNGEIQNEKLSELYKRPSNASVLRAGKRIKLAMDGFEIEPHGLYVRNSAELQLEPSKDYCDGVDKGVSILV